MSYLRVLFIGEIIGSPGVYCVKTLLNNLKKEKKIDFVIANAEGATGGFGLGKNHAVYLHKLGIDVLTSGECIYYKKDMPPFIEKAPYILRPANYPYGNPGRGWSIYKKDKFKIACINLMGQYGFLRVNLDNPFPIATRIIEKIKSETNLIIIDFHAVASAEKNSLFRYLDGKVSAVIGTHTKAITADEHILPNGTGVITDAGRTGSLFSVGGLEPEIEIKKFLTQIHEYSKPSWQKLELQGVILDLDENGKTTAIERLRLEVNPPSTDTMKAEGMEDGEESTAAGANYKQAAGSES